MIKVLTLISTRIDDFTSACMSAFFFFFFFLNAGEETTCSARILSVKNW